MAIEIQSATEADVPRCIEIQFLAFARSKSDNIINGPNTPKNRAITTERLLDLISSGDPSLHVLKAVDTTIINTDNNNINSDETPTSPSSPIIAYCFWHIYTNPRPSSVYTQTHPFLLPTRLDPSSPTRQKAQDGLIAPVTDGRTTHMAGQPCALLMYLATDPSHERRGAGTALLKWGLQRCDELQIPAYLETSRFGMPLYMKYGFEKVGTIDAEFDGESMACPALMRKPQPRVAGTST